MQSIIIPKRRLANQQIAQPCFSDPAQVVHWLGAVQAQDYLGALWAIGLRTQEATEKTIERALNERKIVRTWPMRGTLHFVAAEDVHWMLQLLTPRVIAKITGRERQLGLTEEIFRQARKLFIKHLEGGKQLSRPAIQQLMDSVNINTNESRGLHIIGRLAQEGLICFGPREGKQQTFVLLEEWIPKSKHLEKDEALEELTKRYFASHGPATVHDFAWWSGLTLSDVKRGIAMNNSKLISTIIDHQTYWLSPETHVTKIQAQTTYLLPAFDEYTVSYKNRTAILNPEYTKHLNAGGGMLNPVIVINGLVVGTWKRAFTKNSVHLTLFPFQQCDEIEFEAISVAASQYGVFLGMSVTIS